MRVDLHRPVFVPRGRLVKLECRLPKDSRDARLYVWSGSSRRDLSPHVSYSVIDVLRDGKPVMTRPVSMRLSPHKPEGVFEFPSDDNLFYAIRQEVDMKNDPRAVVKISWLARLNGLYFWLINLKSKRA